MKHILCQNALQFGDEKRRPGKLEVVCQGSGTDDGSIVKLNEMGETGGVGFPDSLKTDYGIEEPGAGPRLGDSVRLPELDDAGGGLLHYAKSVQFQLPEDRSLARSGRASQNISRHIGHFLIYRIFLPGPVRLETYAPAGKNGDAARVVYLLMALGVWRYSFALLIVITAAASDQQATLPAEGVPIVQPGAPGQNSKTLAASAVVITRRAPSAADISFMQGMIHHHAQAVEMVDLLRTRSRNPKVQSLGNRISISQTDEMKYMRQWLTERGQPAPMAHGEMMGGKMAPGKMGPGKMDHAAMGHDMKAMAGMDMSSMPMMPGMLTAEQMKALAKASGPAFDRLFLTGMIQHHTGALIMVEDLFDTAGAGQDNVLYDFATDVDNTQRAEIEIMKSLLKEKK